MTLQVLKCLDMCHAKAFMYALVQKIDEEAVDLAQGLGTGACARVGRSNALKAKTTYIG